MIRRIVEVSSDGWYLSKERGFMLLSHKNGEKNKVPLSDIAVLLCTAQQLSLSKQIISTLGAQGSPIIFCGTSYKPESILLPIAGNYEHSGRLQEQIAASAPLKKQIWKDIVIEKISNQALVLSQIDKTVEATALLRMAQDVQSGDTTNREAVAAKAYWPVLFGKTFTRDTNGDGINAYLNYGYSILRGMIARAVSSVGLHPALGIHHNNKLNTYSLVDDLMEPFRPLVDLTVYQMWNEDLPELDPLSKQRLHKIPSYDVHTNKGKSPLIRAAEYYAYSLTESFQQKRNCLCIPKLIKESIIEQTSPLPF